VQGLRATIGLFNQGAKMITKSEMLADIGIAIVGTGMLIIGFDPDGGLMHKAALMFGGLFYGYLITTYMMADEV
jgi:hypothetical protein